MSIFNESFIITTKGFDDTIDITQKIQNIVNISNVKQGIVNVCLIGSTASILTLKTEPGLVRDLPQILDKIVPINKIYQHDNNWHEGNAYAHLKSALIGNSVSYPIYDKKVKLEDWQQIVLIDFDNKPRTREITVTIVS